MKDSLSPFFVGAIEGFITMELLIAFALGISFLSASLMVVTDATGGSKKYTLESGTGSGLDTLLDSSGLMLSARYFEESLEKRGENWKRILESSGDTIYNLSPRDTYISPCSMSLTGTTVWETLHERERSVYIRGGSTHPTVARAQGKGACDPLPPSSWRNPENPSWTTDSGDIVGTQTGLAYATIGDTSYLFVTTSNISQTNDLWVVDVKDEDNPTVVASLETGDATHVLGLLDIVVVHTDSGIYAYVLQNSGTNQLQVIDVSNPTSLPTPTETISFETYSVSPSGSNPEGRVITYYDGRLYVGLRTTIGPEFLVFDIEDDPSNPEFVGALPNSFDHSIYDIAVEDGYAYLAIKPGSPPSGLPTRELMVLDVRGTPRDTGGGFNATSTTNDTEGGTVLFFIGNRLYMGRERVSNASEKDLYVFDISSSTKPTYIKSRRLLIPTASTLGTPRVVDLVVQNNLVFLVTTDSTRSLQIYDVQNDPDTITPVSSACITSLPLSRLTKIVYKKNRIFALFGIEPTVGIIRDNEALCSI